MKASRLFLMCRRTHIPRCSRQHVDESSLKDRVSQQLEREANAMSRIACFPHRSLTRPALPLTPEFVKSTLFTTRLETISKLASDVSCVSFSGPKGHWDARVILLKGNVCDSDYEVWVNPEVPGYDDQHSVAPMYGMWENCVSCSVCHAWVVRPQRITCKGLDQYGNEKIDVLDGIRARCLMHELDHLGGKSIIQQAVGPEFVVSVSGLAQKDLWPPNFPSAEAYVTPPQHFFDYVQNTVIVPPGLEWLHVRETRHFQDQRLGR